MPVRRHHCLLRDTDLQKQIPDNIRVAGYYHRGLVSIHPGSRDVLVVRYVLYVHFVREGGVAIIDNPTVQNSSQALPPL
jgi:hypothetical protein